jgi:hypothetical protein
MYPIIMFLPPSKPSVCPNCGKEEKKIEICDHCKHEYKDEPLDFWDVMIIIFIVIPALFASIILFVRYILFPIADFIL